HRHRLRRRRLSPRPARQDRRPGAAANITRHAGPCAGHPRLPGHTRLANQMVAFTFAPMILSKASSVSLASGPNTGLTAALHTRMSMPPHCLIVPSTSASTSLRRDTLHGMTIASPPFSLMLAATASSRCSLGYGGKTSAKRSPQQSETARLWLMVGPPAYHPFVRQLVTAKQMSVGDSARLMALAAGGLNEGAFTADPEAGIKDWQGNRGGDLHARCSVYP